MRSLLLRPASWLYGGVMLARNWCYDRGILRMTRCPAPVISVGNMTAGGTGKTPFTELLVRMLLMSGKAVAVISRGYRRSSKGTVVVSDGASLLAGAGAAGDEAYQVAKKFPSAVVIVDERRARAALIAVERYHAEIVVMDDGFQHRALHRDLDIVMLDDRQPIAGIPLLPAGLRREPMSGLRRAGMIAAPDAATEQVMQSARRFSAAPFIRVRKVPVKFVRVFGEGSVSPEAMRGKECAAVCGIGNPDSFRETLRMLGMRADPFIAFPDHHAYTARELGDLLPLLGRTASHVLVTTEKDAVKFRSMNMENIAGAPEWYYLEIAAEIAEGEEILRGRIDELFHEEGQ